MGISWWSVVCSSLPSSMSLTTFAALCFYFLNLFHFFILWFTPFFSMLVERIFGCGNSGNNGCLARCQACVFKSRHLSCFSSPTIFPARHHSHSFSFNAVGEYFLFFTISTFIYCVYFLYFFIYYLFMLIIIFRIWCGALLCP